MTRALHASVVAAWVILLLHGSGVWAQQKSLAPAGAEPVVLPPLTASSASFVTANATADTAKSSPAPACSVCCCPETPKCDASRLTFSGEYLLWWMSGRPMPANLVTTGPVVTGNPLTSSGPVGNPGTQTLFGGSQNAGAFSGAAPDRGIPVR